MNVVMLSKTPLAGAPYENAKCINKYSNGEVSVRWVSLKDRYLDGRIFPSDLIYGAPEADQAIASADIFHVHNEPFPGLETFRGGRKVLVQLHSCPLRATLNQMLALSQHRYTISQPMQLRAYQLPGLPNMLDPEEYLPLDEKRTKPRIVFAPTNEWSVNMVGSKGSNEVKVILAEFQNEFEIEFMNKMPYVLNLDVKRHSDILIDDVVGNTFHRTSLEGCCFGLAVLSSTNEGGWIFATLQNLREVLTKLAREKRFLEESRRRSRQWLTTAWHPRNLVWQYVDAYKLLGR